MFDAREVLSAGRALSRYGLKGATMQHVVHNKKSRQRKCYLREQLLNV